MRLRSTMIGAAGLATALVAATLTLAQPASAASLVEVTGFGTNPSNLRMHLYVPDRVQARPGILVAVHYCTGSGPAFYSGTQFAQQADQYGFIVIYPSVTQASDGCFDVASAQTLRHDGGSDSLGIVSMVRYALSTYNADPARVYATGVSSGAMMTNVLLGAYPDIFKAGSAFAGVPFACFSGPNSWNSDCASGLITKTPQQWGDLVRAGYPGYSGARPRMQLWHGTADTTLHYVNFGEEIKQWTNVHGLSQTPTSTDTPQSGWTRTRYAGGSTVLVEAISMQGVGHNLPVQAAAAIAYFGLNVATSPSATPSSASPSPSRSPSTSPSASPSTSPTGGARSCAATFTVTSSWAGGFVATVKVTAGGSSISGWKVTLALPAGAAVTNSWNGQFSAAAGTIMVTNMSYNGTLGAGQSTEFGFQGSGSATGTTVACTAS
jgi:acetylxylan esterase